MSFFEDVRREINRTNALPLAIKRSLRDAFKYVDTLVSILEGVAGDNLLANQLLSGGASWLSGLIFRVSPCVYVLGGEKYESQATNVTLSAADVTHPRIDVIVVDINSQVDVVEGTAAANPVKPEIDYDTQVEVTFVNIAAGASTPTDVANIVIYDEDDDWTTTETGNVVSDSTSGPYAGTKCIAFSEADQGDKIVLTSSSDVTIADADEINFYIKMTASLTPTSGPIRQGKNRLVFFLSKDGERVSSIVNLVDGAYGFKSHDTDNWQYIAIPLQDFDPSDTAFDSLVIGSRGAQTVSAKIDNINYQSGVPNTNTPDYARLSLYNAWTKAQGSPIENLTDGATIEIDLREANVFAVTLGGNRTIDFINPTPGQHFTMLITQDPTGSRTLTWDAVNDWAGGTAPTLSTGGGAVDILSFVVDTAGNIHGTLGIVDSQ